ncbi:MAG TPA: hypothetical protein VFC86_07900 [Planctomycetota bacterium]|nr:hypothetical protein [Planctomycetota bacterium]
MFRHELLLATSIALATAGCHGGDFGQTFAFRERDRTTQLLWSHTWEPVQFFVYKSCQGRMERLSVLIEAPAEGRTYDLASDDIAVQYDHGYAMNPCNKPHRAQGSVTLLSRKPDRIRCRVDATLTCPESEAVALKGEFDFEFESGHPR